MRLVLALLCLCSAPTFAQTIPGIPSAPQRSEAAEAPPAAVRDQAEPAAIPVERIPGRLEATRELVRRARETAPRRPATKTVEQELAELQVPLEAFEQRTRQDSLERMDMRSLDTMLEQAASLRRSVNAWQRPLGERATELSDWRDTIRHALQSWTLTAEQVPREELPDQVFANVRTIQDELRQASRQLGERQGEILTLQTRVAEWLTTIDERQAVIEAELSRARAEMFRPEHPPIWKGEAALPDLAASRETWRSDRETLSSYLLARQGNAWMHFGLLVVLLGAFAMLARKVGRWIEDKPSLGDSLAVFRHPIAAALVLAILAWPWFYPDAPVVLRDLFGVLLVLPLLRVLTLVVAASLRVPLYLFVGLYLLLRLNELLDAGTTLDRYYLLGLTAAAVGTLAWVFRPAGRGTKLDAGRWWRAAQLVARFSIVILAAALLANFGGLVSLSRLLTTAVISSAFTAIVLFAGVVVVRATVIAVLQTRVLQRVNLVRWHGAAIDYWLMRILPLAALLTWLVVTARFFRIEGPLGNIVSTVFFTSATIGTVQISLGDILAFGLAIWLGLLFSRALRFVLSVDVFPRVTLPRGIPATISMLVNYTVLGIAFVLAVAAAGIQLERFALIVGALSVGIGFGLQNIVNNFVSGLILAFERPVQSGDTVQFSSTFGKISRIGVRSSTVRTFDGAEVIVPNANLISNEVTNWTLSDMRRRIEIMVGVAYGTNPHKVLELLLKAAGSDERLLAEPQPNALFLGFGDSSLDFSLRAWTDDFDNYLSIKSALTLAVHDAIYAAGIEIPFPQRDLHVRSIDPQAVARIGAVQAPPVGEGDDKNTAGG